MSFAYVMNQMGEGTVGDIRGAGLLMAAYARARCPTSLMRQPGRPRPAQTPGSGQVGQAAVQASRSSADIVLMTRSIGTSRSAARSQPCGCHSSWPVAWASVSIENQQP